MISYAQNFEDVMLRRALQDVEAGFYIDIGACDPLDLSVTKSFYDAGWRGINIEPNPEFAERLSQARPRDITLQCAVSDRDARSAFHIVEGTGLSSLLRDEPAAVAENAGNRRTIEVETRRLSTIWEEHVGEGCVDFLKIDAEGAEIAIISSTDFRIYRPRIIVVESTEPFSQRAAWAGFEAMILGGGYLFAYFDGLNRFYVRSEDAHRLSAFALPPCLFDNSTPRMVVDLQRRIDELTDAFHHQADLIAHQQAHLDQLQAALSALPAPSAPDPSFDDGGVGLGGTQVPERPLGKDSAP